MEHPGCRSSNAASKKKIVTASVALQLQPPRHSLYRAPKTVFGLQQQNSEFRRLIAFNTNSFLQGCRQRSSNALELLPSTDSRPRDRQEMKSALQKCVSIGCKDGNVRYGDKEFGRFLKNPWVYALEKLLLRFGVPCANLYTEANTSTCIHVVSSFVPKQYLLYFRGETMDYKEHRYCGLGSKKKRIFPVMSTTRTDTDEEPDEPKVPDTGSDGGSDEPKVSDGAHL
uniref:Doublecortin domain-containing protein n=1 Tax=Steinernema glaseri TaxID=37863 RepID=A0A1I7ZV33_9BILA